MQGLARREYADFRVSSDGEVQGVGLLIAADPSSGRLVVLAPITGGPADRAGIQPGDEVGPCLGKQGQRPGSVPKHCFKLVCLAPCPSCPEEAGLSPSYAVF